MKMNQFEKIIKLEECCTTVADAERCQQLFFTENNLF